MLKHVYNPSTCEAETGGPDIQGHPHLQRKLKASRVCMSNDLKNNLILEARYLWESTL